MVRATARQCSVARALDVVGEKWSLLVVRECLLGSHRFEEILAGTGAPRDTLAARLRTLVDAGVLERRRYNEHPPRDEYHLTEAGRGLQPVVLSLMQWGDRHLAGPEGPPRILAHDCGHHLTHHLVCDSCGGDVGQGSTRTAVLHGRPVD